MKYAMADFHDGIETILRDPTMKTVSVFCHPLSSVTQRVRVTRRSKNELLVTYGKPNYAEREFLNKCKVAKCKPRRMLFSFKRGSK